MDVFKRIFRGQHYKIERFTILLSICFIIFILDVVSIFVKYQKDTHRSLTGTVMYTASFTTSKSQQTGKVVNVYSNTAGTRCFILLKYDNAQNVTADANNYQMFICGSDVNGKYQILKTKPQGSIYVLGDTGYMGIYLTAASGFDSQIMQLTVRNNSVLVNSEASADASFSDDSYKNYDQFRIFFNPGGADKNVAAFLNDDTFKMSQVYKDYIIANDEKTIRDTLDTNISDMNVSLNKIEEYEKQLELYCKITERPADIKGDEVIKESDGTLTYKPASVLNKGFDFDWRNGSISTGYLNALSGASTSDGYSSYLLSKENEAESQFSTKDLKFYMKDGTEVTTGSTVNSNLDKNMSKAISLVTSLTAEYSNYMSLKKTYQCTNLKNLLYLEYDSSYVDSSITLNNSDKIITFY